MLCRSDIEELWDLKQGYSDLMVVKHEYRTKYPVKYLGQRNEDYERKNWSSLMLINCGQAVWRRPAYKQLLSGPVGLLHRFAFLEDERIGELPKEWNWLVSEYDHNPQAKLVHYTIGIPTFYPRCDYADEWTQEFRQMTHADQWADDTPLVSER